MRAQAGHAVHFVERPELAGYVSARLGANTLGVITTEGYHFTSDDRVVVDGEHPEQWDRHAHLRGFGRY